MKRIILTLALSLMTFGIYAQEHLSFKGIPIEGSMTSFCQKLQSKGLTKLSSDNNITLFAGDFTGRQVTIFVLATDDGQNVQGVVVGFDPSDEWNTLVGAYDYYKELYTRKYGNPIVNKEYNPSVDFGGSNNSLMYELRQGSVIWVSAWEVTGGAIGLTIEKSDSYGGGVVSIKYLNAFSFETKIQNDLNDI